MSFPGSAAARAACVGTAAFLAVAVYAISGSDLRAQQDGAASVTPANDPGRAVYERHCIECHGRSGAGDGPAATVLVPHPRDFRTGRYKIRSTETGSVPTDADLIRTIRLGLPGSSMPGWEDILSAADIQAVAGYIKTFSSRFASEAPDPILVAARPASSPQGAARGAMVYEKLQCGKCHGSDGRGTDAVATSFQDDWGFPLRATDLTEPWTFHGGTSAQDIFMRFRAGMAGTPMPSFVGAASDAEMWDLAAFVVSLKRKAVWEMTADEVVEHYRGIEAAERANPIKRGEFLVTTLGCVLCHTPLDADRQRLPGLFLAGGLKLEVTPFGTFPTGNLTSDPETGLGSWSDDEIKRAITKGVLRDGSRMLPFPMDWPAYSTLKPSDLDAIVSYLRTVPAVRNKVPRWSRPILPLYLWGKFQMLILGGDPPMNFYAGNAGDAKGAN
ncbi:MAG: c-type cytochrome [Vicinamibacterales bacterium]